MRMSASAEASEFRNSPCGSATISIRRPRGNSALMPFAVSAATLRRKSAFIEAPQTAIDDIDHRLAATEEVDIAGKCLRAPLDGPLCIGAKGRYGVMRSAGEPHLPSGREAARFHPPLPPEGSR